MLLSCTTFVEFLMTSELKLAQNREPIHLIEKMQFKCNLRGPVVLRHVSRNACKLLKDYKREDSKNTNSLNQKSQGGYSIS